MLTPDEWDKIGNQAVKVYSGLEEEIIKEIAERIANVGYANTVVLNDIEIAQEMGLMYQDIIRLVAEYNNASESQIKSIFDTAGAKTIKIDDLIYKKVGLNPVPLYQSKSMLQILEATAKRTNFNLSNLTMTTANTAQTQFYNAMNKAYMEVSTGVKSYSQSILDTIKEISDKGAVVTYPSGKNVSIESAIRMNVMTSVSQMCGKLQEIRADEMGCDLMELSAHSGARPEHAEWQGKIVSRSGKKGYLSLKDIGYGEVTGFKGINCKHDWHPFYEGMTRTYTDKEIEKINNETVKYNGKDISKYEASQMQRAMERKIRQDKKDIKAYEGILSSNTTDEELIKETQDKLKQTKSKMTVHNEILNKFLDETGFRKDYVRLKI